jgi:hypothetical protein
VPPIQSDWRTAAARARPVSACRTRAHATHTDVLERVLLAGADGRDRGVPHARRRRAALGHGAAREGVEAAVGAPAGRERLAAGEDVREDAPPARAERERAREDAERDADEHDQRREEGVHCAGRPRSARAETTCEEGARTVEGRVLACVLLAVGRGGRDVGGPLDERSRRPRAIRRVLERGGGRHGAGVRRTAKKSQIADSTENQDKEESVEIDEAHGELRKA